MTGWDCRRIFYRIAYACWAKLGLVTSRRDTIDGRWIYCAVDKETVGQWVGPCRGYHELGRSAQERYYPRLQPVSKSWRIVHPYCARSILTG